MAPGDSFDPAEGSKSSSGAEPFKRAYIPSVTSRKAFGLKGGARAKAFVCTHCNAEYIKWMGRCPGCEQWNTLVEFEVSREPINNGPLPRRTAGPRTASGGPKATFLGNGFFRAGEWISTDGSGMVSQTDLDDRDSKESRIKLADDAEMTRVLGGGIVKGSLVLVGGEPGVGKSTLMLQVAGALAKHDGSVEGPALYVSGEESVSQVSSRAVRLGIREPLLYLMAETDADVVVEQVLSMPGRPSAVIIDSIQTMRCEGVASAAGSVTMVKEVAARLLQLAKGYEVAIFLLGHVTKAGTLAGPRVLEHMVDTVMYLEGDRFSSYRMLRGVKNRYGPSGEIGVYEMTAGNGVMAPVANPSAAFLSNWDPEGGTHGEGDGDDGDEEGEGGQGQQPANVVDGSVVLAAMEGSKPMLVEVQSLVTMSRPYGGRRAAEGISLPRLNILLAVLEKRLGYSFVTREVFVNLVGGLRLVDTALDLAVAAVVMSSYTSIPISPDVVMFGEVGLGGELRPVPHADRRISEAAKYGFHRVVMPRGRGKESRRKEVRKLEGPHGVDGSVTIHRCRTLAEALDVALMHPLPPPRRRAAAAGKAGGEAGWSHSRQTKGGGRWKWEEGGKQEEEEGEDWEPR